MAALRMALAAGCEAESSCQWSYMINRLLVSETIRVACFTCSEFHDQHA